MYPKVYYGALRVKYLNASKNCFINVILSTSILFLLYFIFIQNQMLLPSGLELVPKEFRVWRVIVEQRRSAYRFSLVALYLRVYHPRTWAELHKKLVRLRPRQFYKISNVTARRLQFSQAMYCVKYLKASPEFKS